MVLEFSSLFSDSKLFDEERNRTGSILNNTSLTIVTEGTILNFSTFITADALTGQRIETGYNLSYSIGNSSGDTRDITLDIENRDRPIIGPPITTLLNDLLIYYNLDENSGTTVTDSVGTSNGTSANCTVNQTGKIDKAYLFNGTNSLINSNYSSDILTNVSCFLWINLDSLAEQNELMGQTAGGFDNGWDFRVLPTGELQYDVNGVGGVVTTGANITTGGWIHVGFTITGNNISFYKNGSSLGTFAISGSRIAAQNLHIGGNSLPNSGRVVDGLLDEVGIWDRAITSGEIVGLYNSGDGIPYPLTYHETTFEQLLNIDASISDGQFISDGFFVSTDKISPGDVIGFILGGDGVGTQVGSVDFGYGIMKLDTLFKTTN